MQLMPTPTGARAVRVLRPTAVTAVIVTCALTLITGCGTQPSASGFCKVYWEQKHSYLDKYDQANPKTKQFSQDSPLAGALLGLANSLQAMGDIVIMFDKLDKAAPDDIEPDVAAIRDSLKAQIASSGGMYKDPIGGALGGLVSGFTTMGSWDRVGKYVVANCGEKT